MKATLLFSIFILNCSTVFSQWNSNPAINTAISTSANNQKDARIVTDSKSGAIITWVDYKNSLTSGDIYAQRINYAGINKWTTNGVVICNDISNQTAVASDDAGNGSAVFAWNDWRSGNKDIYVQKIDSSGNIQWISNGIGIAIKNAHQADPKIISDGSGGAIVVWQDSVSGNWDIYAQRINSSGSIQWTSGGVVICNAANSQINPKLESDGLGGVIITWQDKRNGIEYDIYAQRINASGTIQWIANGIAICNSPDGQTNPKIEPDGANGAYIAWQDKRNGNDYNIFTQRINSSGATQWTANGVPVCTAIGNQSAIDITSDLINGVIVTWKDQRTGVVQVYVDMLNPLGASAWTTLNGTYIANGINPNIIGDANGGAIITWQDSTTASGAWNVYSQRIDANGTQLWNSGGTAIAIANGGQTSPKNVADGNGGSIYTWQDKRNTIDLDIFAHKLNTNGVISIAEHKSKNNLFEIICYPNPSSNQTNIKINSNTILQTWMIIIYDTTGKKIMTKLITNSNQTIIDTSQLPNGIYYYQATNENKLLGSNSFHIQK